MLRAGNARATFTSSVPFTLRRGKLKAQQSPVLFWAGKSIDYRNVVVFKKRLFLNLSCPHENKNTGVFQFVRSEEHFRKVLFLWRISVYGRLTGLSCVFKLLQAGVDGAFVIVIYQSSRYEIYLFSVYNHSPMIRTHPPAKDTRSWRCSLQRTRFRH